MQRTIITGLSGGTIYQNFPQATYGAWNQQLLGTYPYHYMLGGQIYNINPRPPGTQAYSPYLGPSVPFSIRRRF
ncbi:hypothetical protein NDK25_21935 [Niallia taxi]|nr:hypothetical protein [Niallia taxi]MDE5054878.1 hypothetical protein [Niallia taxi]